MFTQKPKADVQFGVLVPKFLSWHPDKQKTQDSGDPPIQHGHINDGESTELHVKVGLREGTLLLKENW